MFPTSVRPQHLAGGATLTVKEAMEGSAPVAFVHKACAWLDRSSTVPTNTKGCSFPKKCPQCNLRLATKLCFMYGSPRLASLVTAPESRREKLQENQQESREEQKTQTRAGS